MSSTERGAAAWSSWERERSDCTADVDQRRSAAGRTGGAEPVQQPLAAALVVVAVEVPHRQASGVRQRVLARTMSDRAVIASSMVTVNVPGTQSSCGSGLRARCGSPRGWHRLEGVLATFLGPPRLSVVGPPACRAPRFLIAARPARAGWPSAPDAPEGGGWPGGGGRCRSRSGAAAGASYSSRPGRHLRRTGWPKSARRLVAEPGAGRGVRCADTSGTGWRSR